MEVKDIFNLRKEGRIEEAYDAIRPMYAVHKGKYTSLCMFFTAHDVMNLRIQQRRIEEATQIFRSMSRLYPNLQDADGQCRSTLLWDAVRLADANRTFNILAFMEYFGVEHLTDADWKREKKDGRWLPSLAEKLICRAYRPVRDNKTLEAAQQFMPLLEAMAQRLPRDRKTQLYKARVYQIMGEWQKAKEIYDRLLPKKGGVKS